MQLPGGLRILRPGNAIVSAAGVYVGAILSGAPWVPTFAVGAGMLAGFAFAAAGNVRNDITDVEIDRLAHPTRPLVTGEVSPAQARSLVVGLYLLALAAGALVSWAAFALVLLALPLMEGYERFAKRRGLAGNLIVGLLTGAPFVLGMVAASVGSLANPLAIEAVLLAALAVVATTAREILKDAEDVDADRGVRRTLPMAIGLRGAGIVAAVLLVAAVALSPLPWLLGTLLAPSSLGALVPADLLFLAAATTAWTPSRAQRLAKLGMVAALAGVLVGRLVGV